MSPIALERMIQENNTEQDPNHIAVSLSSHVAIKQIPVDKMLIQSKALYIAMPSDEK